MAVIQEPVSWPFANKFAGHSGVVHGILASADGFLLGDPFGSLSRDAAEQLAAVAATVVGAGRSIQRAFATRSAAGESPQTVITAGQHSYLIVPIADTVIVALFVDGSADLGMLAYEVTQLGRHIPAHFYLP